LSRNYVIAILDSIRWDKENCGYAMTYHIAA
jgi:hypothetical protein